MAHYFECHPRTISRYLTLLEEVGYFIDEDGQRRKLIFKAEPDQPPYFSPEEIGLLRQAQVTLDPESPLGESMRRKLYLTSELIPQADEERLGFLSNSTSFVPESGRTSVIKVNLRKTKCIEI